MADIDTSSREALLESLPHGGIAAEIGVWRGATASVILERNRPSKLFLIDCWGHQRGSYENDGCNVADGEHDANFRQVQGYFRPFRQVQVLRMYSLEAAAMFRPYYFDWVHFDGDHARLAEDFHAWRPLVRPGGWYTGHDYCDHGGPRGVKAVVDRVVGRSRLYVTREPDYPSWAFQRT